MFNHASQQPRQPSGNERYGECRSANFDAPTVHVNVVILEHLPGQDKPTKGLVS